MTGPPELRVSVVRGGGLAGIVVRAELRSSDLPAADRRRLHAAVAESGLRQLAGRAAAPAAHPDELSYRVEVSSPHGEVAAGFAEHELTPPLRALIESVEGCPQTTRSVGAVSTD